MKPFLPPPSEAGQTLKVGHLRDYVSGIEVRATPEEVDAVQVFSQRLVEDFGYPIENLQTRPQFRVRRSPSDEVKSFPIDIAVFNSDLKDESSLFMVVECKKKNRKDGLIQLKLYLDMSPAEIGVWFNGDDHIYLRKIFKRGGSRDYVELPNIPRFGQRVEDIGQFSRGELRAPSNLKAVFRDIRNHLAGMTTGITRDEALAQEIINILFCKILDEQETAPGDIVAFRAGIDETPKEIKSRIDVLFEGVKTRAFGDVFMSSDVINLDAASVRYVVGELQNYSVMEADRDAIGDAFEVFIGPALRGAEGQFFTPRNVVKMIIDMLDPQPGDKIIDPACGSGGFLIAALEHVWDHLKKQGKERGWSERQLTQREIQVATDCFRGLDKDGFLAKVCKAYMALIGDGRGGVFCENSLNDPKEWSADAQAKIGFETFDLVVTNPPFGSKIAIKGATTLAQYQLGHKWKRDKSTDRYVATNELEAQRAPQTLFLERCLQLLKPKTGRMGIVLPESMISNPSYQYVLEFLKTRATILGVITMPEALFKTSGKGGTHTKVAVLLLRKDVSQKPTDIFMSDVKWCGHDSRGNPTLRKDPITGIVSTLDEVPLVPGRFKSLFSGRGNRDHLGYLINASQITNHIMVPKYYDPEIEQALESLKDTHDLVPMLDYINGKVVSLSTGVEPGKMAYGTGTIPFIRTSDLSNWELKADFKHGVSEAIYQEYAKRCSVAEGDILMVRDGTYLIGTSAVVTSFDLPMLFQSHLIRLRVLKPDELDPWVLFACLNTPIVKRQIRSKQFTQDIIDTLGGRLAEIILPIPKDPQRRKDISAEVRDIVISRAALRNRAKEVALNFQGDGDAAGLDIDLLEDA